MSDWVVLVGEMRRVAHRENPYGKLARGNVLAAAEDYGETRNDASHSHRCTDSASGFSSIEIDEGRKAIEFL